MAKNYLVSKTLWVNFIALVAIIAQGQFGIIVDIEAQASMIIVINIILRTVTGEELVWATTD
ncbi:MAG: hypothetical protein U9Q68_03860 [Euryarchaeota archaeon]|nr:hypothetical protein [Euryarchaeota archaeon]